MNDYTKIFDKLIDLIDWKTLQKYTYLLNTDYKVSNLFTKDHLKLMIYFHIAEISGLRDLNDAVHFNSGLKGSLKKVSLGALSHQNNNRDFKVFIPVMESLMKQALNVLPNDSKVQKYNNIELVDSTTISMCLTYFEWAEFRSTKAGVKIHTRFNLGKQIPDSIIITNAEKHDSMVMDSLMDKENTIFIYDKAYSNYKKFDDFTDSNKFFITRLKDNALVTTEQELEVTYLEPSLLENDIQIISDKLAYLGSLYTYRTKNLYRIVKVKDSSNKEITFVSNILDFTSEEIAWLYKKRWDIELFFKWIKQHLRIKKFIGHSHNAVMIQLITAIITYILLRLIANKSNVMVSGLLKIKRKIKYCLTEPINSAVFDWAKWLSG